MSIITEDSKSLKRIINIPTQNAFHQCNSGMGGTNRMDQNINAFRVLIRGKKMVVVNIYMDVGLQHAWIPRQMRGEIISQQTFKREVAMTYQKCHQSKTKGPSRKSKNAPGGENPRYDQRSHPVIPIPNNKRRCMGEECTSIVKTQCQKCDVGLCVFCFAYIHTL